MLAQIDSNYIKLRPTKVVSRMLSYGLFEGRPVTTKGQWINPLVFALFSLEKKLPQLKKVDRPIFITGSGRSGTTMLGVLMSMHKDVGFLNEPKAMWHSIYNSEDIIGSYSSDDSDRYVLDKSDASSAVVRDARKLFGAYLRSVLSSRLVDKYPEHIFRIPFVKEIFPDAKIIFLVRNGWDTCVSINQWSKRLGKCVNGTTHDWWGVNQKKWRLIKSQLLPSEPLLKGLADIIDGFDDHLNMAAVEWIITMQYGLRQAETFKDTIHMVKYEDIVKDPVNELAKLLEFCELKDDGVFIDYAKLTLQEGRTHDEFDLHESIKPAFYRTMTDLGY